MPPAISADRLSLDYGPGRGIFGVTFDIESEICALVGNNGAGKTTLLETLQGLRVPQSGSARILGLDPIRDRSTLASLLGSALQSATPYPTAKAGELISYFASLYPNPFNAAALMNTFEIPARTSIRSLSGGEVQRLKCALALVGRPKVVILDEPTAGLDPGARMNLYQVLNEYAANGVTMMISTHLTEDLDAMADRAIVLDHGHIVSDIWASQLKSTEVLQFRSRPGLPINQLQNALSRDYEVRAQIDGLYSVESDSSIPASVLATVASWCAEHNAVTNDLTVTKNSLASTVMKHFSSPRSGNEL